MGAFFKENNAVPNYPSINKRPTKRREPTSGTKLKDHNTSTPMKDSGQSPNKNEHL